MVLNRKPQWIKHPGNEIAIFQLHATDRWKYVYLTPWLASTDKIQSAIKSC